MAEYIDKQEAIETVAFYREDPDGVDHALRSIKDIPAADVQPVRHGKWVKTDDDPEDTAYQCSVCGKEALYKYNTCDSVCSEYCPNCGAAMDGDKNG